MRHSRTIAAALLFLFFFSARPCCAAAAEPKELSGSFLFFAAASTTDVMEELRKEFTRLHPDVTIRTSYGASSALAQQIAAGAQADLFLSASSQWSDFLARGKQVEKQRDLLANELVVIVPAGSALKLDALDQLGQAKIRRIALADTKSVPAGIYAKQALTAAGVWTKVESKVTGAADVRQALQFVQTAAAEAGIVYATDAAASKDVRVALHVDPKLTEPIRYPLVLLKHGADNAAALALYEFLASEPASVIFRQYGFVPLAEPAKP